MTKTTSLETSKLLKEAGFPQAPDLFVYHYFNVDGNIILNRTGSKKYWLCVAPNTDELLEELKSNRLLRITWLGKSKHWFASIRLAEDEYKGFEKESLPEALAAMWLWLKKEGLIE